MHAANLSADSALPYFENSTQRRRAPLCLGTFPYLYATRIRRRSQRRGDAHLRNIAVCSNIWPQGSLGVLSLEVWPVKKRSSIVSVHGSEYFGTSLPTLLKGSIASADTRARPFRRQGSVVHTDQWRPGTATANSGAMTRRREHSPTTSRFGPPLRGLPKRYIEMVRRLPHLAACCRRYTEYRSRPPSSFHPPKCIYRPDNWI